MTSVTENEPPTGDEARAFRLLAHRIHRYGDENAMALVAWLSPGRGSVNQ